MEAKTNYAIVGVIVVILTAALIACTLWLSVGFDKKRYDVYAVYMSEAVSGLSDDAPVKFSGVKVGHVKSIRLNKNNPQEVEILLNIEHGVPVTTSTTATLISLGITGTSYVGLSASSGDLTPLRAAKGDPYPIIPAKPSIFNQLDNALKGVSEDINSVTLELKRVFDEENAKNLKEILIHFSNFTGMLDRERPEIVQMIENISDVSEKFPPLSNKLDAGLTMITDQTLPALNRLLLHLDQVSIDLHQTTREMRTNPSVIIRGTKPPPPGPGE